MPCLQREEEKRVLRFLRGENEKLSQKGGHSFSEKGDRVEIVSSDFVSFRRVRNDDMDDSPTIVQVLAFPADEQEKWTKLRPEKLRQQLSKFKGVVALFEHMDNTFIGTVSSVWFDDKGNMHAEIIILAINQQPTEMSKRLARKVIGALISGTLKGVSVAFRKEYDPHSESEFADSIVPLEISFVFKGKTDTKILNISLSENQKLDEDIFFFLSMSEIAANKPAAQEPPKQQLGQSSDATAMEGVTTESKKDETVQLSEENTKKIGKLSELMGAPAKPTIGDDGKVIMKGSEEDVKLSVLENVFNIDPKLHQGIPKEVKDALFTFNNNTFAPAVQTFSDYDKVKTELSELKKADEEKTKELNEIKAFDQALVKLGKDFFSKRYTSNQSVEKLNSTGDLYQSFGEYCLQLEKAKDELTESVVSLRSQLSTVANLSNHMGGQQDSSPSFQKTQPQVSLSAASDPRMNKRAYEFVSNNPSDSRRQEPLKQPSDNLRQTVQNVEKLSAFVHGYSHGHKQQEGGTMDAETMTKLAHSMGQYANFFGTLKASQYGDSLFDYSAAVGSSTWENSKRDLKE